MNRREFVGLSAGALIATASSAAHAEATRPGRQAPNLPGAASFGKTQIVRQEVAGSRGAIAAGDLRTAAAGARIIEKGGNAVDAAIAAAFMAYVVEPASAGVGGHGRMTVHMEKSGKTVGIDHYIRAPSGATPATYAEALRRSGQDTTVIAHTGHLSVGVIGTVAGICAAHERFASMPLSELMEEAIGAAEDGPFITPDIERAIMFRRSDLEMFPAAREFLMPRGEVPAPASTLVFDNGNLSGRGSRLDTSDLARTMKQIASDGAAAIYSGRIAEAIDSEMRANNGVLSAVDLGRYKPAVFDETFWKYRSYSYTTCSDLLGPQFMNIIETFDVSSLDPNGVDYRHIVAESLALAFTDAFYYPQDPQAEDAPRRGLSSKEYAEVQAKRIKMSQAIGKGDYTPGDPWPYENVARHSGSADRSTLAELPGTTSVTVGDAEGNVVSFITSLGSAFGSLVLVPDTGIFLGNAMQWFDPRPGRANSIAPGRMPMYGAPLMTTYEDGKPRGAIAGAGGWRIATSLFHTFMNRVDHGMGIQEALEHPRLHTEGGDLFLDERIPAPVINELMKRGHTISVVPAQIASPNAVWRDNDGLWHAGSNPNSGGTAAVS